MRRILPSLLTAAACVAALALGAPAQAAGGKPILIGLDTPLQLQVGKDTIAAVEMAISEINAKGGVLGRKLAYVAADEGMDPQLGVSAINKLTSDDHVDVLIGGYDSGVTLAEEPHIAASKTIWLGVGSASPNITALVGKDYDKYKYIFRVNPLNSALQAKQIVDFAVHVVKGQLGRDKVAILGESAIWVRGLVPVLVKGLEANGMKVTYQQLFDETMTDFTPLFARVKDSGAQFLLTIISHANSDVFVKQLYEARLPMPYGGIDVKSMTPNFCSRVNGAAVGETTVNFITRAPITDKTIPFWDDFVKVNGRAPVYTAPGAYNAVYLYAWAVEKAGTTDADKVIKELEKADYLGVAGKIKFDKVHDDLDGPGYQNLLFVQWQKGCERAVVWPKSVATGKVVLPSWVASK
jgi:branched-chain amino acid transport system substrate-binding protein